MKQTHENTDRHRANRTFICEVCDKPARCGIKHCDGYCAPVHARCLKHWNRSASTRSSTEENTMKPNDYSIEHASANLYAAVMGHDGFDVEQAKVDLTHALREHTQFLAIGEGAWGRGFSREQALDAMVKAGGRRSKYILYSTLPGVVVNGYGGLTYPGAYEALGVKPYDEVDRRGFKKS